MKKKREGEARRASESYGGRKRSQIHFIKQPEAIVEKARGGLESQSWEEIVVGLTVTTGRCVPEILKTGVLFPKKPYTLLFSAYLEQIDEVVGPFELPTLVEAGLVLEAWQRVRRLLPCTQMDASALCLMYRPQVEACARAQFAELAALEASADGYTPLLRQIYALIAARYYCPNLVDRSWFMDLVQGFERTPSDDRIRAQWCAACRQPCCTYEIDNGAGGCDSRQGIKLELPGYDLLDCLKEHGSGEEVEEKVSSTAPRTAKRSEGKEEVVEVSSLIQDQGTLGDHRESDSNRAQGECAQERDCPSAAGHVWTLEEVKAAIAADPNIDDDWDEEDLEVLRLAMSMEIRDSDGNIDRRRGIKLGEPGVAVLDVFKEAIRPPEETEEEQMEEEALDDDCCEIAVLNETRAHFDQVAQQLGTQSDDETLDALLTIRDQRRAVIDQVLFELGEEFKQAQESKERNSSEEERSVVNEEDEDEERDDRVMNMLIDTYEQQGYGVHVYFSQRIMQMLEPLAKEFGTSTPIPTLQALVAAYRARAGLDQKGVEPLSRIHVQEEDDEEIMDGHHGLRPGAPSVEMFHQGGEEEEQQEVLSEPESDARRCANVSLKVDDLTPLTRGSVQEAEEGVSTLSTQRELDLVQRLLACFIFEVQVNVIENEPPMEILDTLATLVDHAPPEILTLVEHLRRTPPEEQEEDYPDTLPSFVDGDR